jgi:hypothetical protein
MADVLTLEQLASRQSSRMPRATVQLAEMKAAYDAANAVQAVTPERAAIDEILSGINLRSTVGRFLTGCSGSGMPRQDEITVANEWKCQLLADPEMQRKLDAGAPDMRAKLLLHAVWAPGAHEVSSAHRRMACCRRCAISSTGDLLPTVVHVLADDVPIDQGLSACGHVRHICAPDGQRAAKDDPEK